MSRRRIWFAAALFAVGCAPGFIPRAAPERVTVGVIGSFSGEGAAVANGISRGIEMAISEYNGDSVNNFEARIERADTGGTPEGAAEAARKTASTELLIGVVGPFTGSEATGAGPVLDESGIPFLIPSVTDLSLTRSGWRNLRRLVSDDRQEGAAVARQVREMIRRTGGGRAAVIHDGSPSGSAFAEGVKAALENSGAGVARFNEVSGAVDWNARAVEIMKDPPAAVVHGGAADRAGALVGALRGAGFKGLFVASHQARDSAFARSAGAAASGSISSCTCADPADPALEDFRDAYRGEFSESPPVHAIEAYEGTIMLLEAIQEVEPKPAEVGEFLRSARSFLGDTKLYQYAEDGGLLTEAVWMDRFRDGRWRFLGRGF